MSIKKNELFEYSNRSEFQTKLVEWIGDVLYDEIPEHGYEVRDEQIFTAFQIADAFGDRKVHLAEAGLGTGKTFAYLLSAIPYARFTGKPVVIACATTALQEQLAGADGDVQTLAKLLGIDIDVQMAKDPNEYICDLRVNENITGFGKMTDEINLWLRKTKTGERSEMPMIPDYIWKKMKWVESMTCDICTERGYCKLVKARERYRVAKDLIIVDHETFFHDMLTREERIANKQLPILPAYSAVIFDEGHKILLPASMQAGQQISQEEIDGMVGQILELQGAREALSRSAGMVETTSNVFFACLKNAIIGNKAAERLTVARTESLVLAADSLRKAMDQLLLDLQIEQELYMDSLSPTQIQAFEALIDRATLGLDRYGRNKGQNVITWVDGKEGTFWVVPRNMSELLNKYLYNKEMPIILTSATLSNEGDFDYFARSIGLNNPSTSTIGSPFDLENQMVVQLEQTDEKIERLAQLLEENGGRALILTNSLRELRKIRRGLEKYEFPFELLWEDEGDRGYLVRRFRENETSVLVGMNFWEGIDVPGEALTLVVIWELPLNESDPLIEEQRREARINGLDPVLTVDYKRMGLKLKQGCGRLIRTEEDHGTILILDSVIGEPWEEIVRGALPEEAKVL